MSPLVVLVPFVLIAFLWGPLIVSRIGLIGGAVAVLFCGACLGYDFWHTSVVTSDRALLGLLVVVYFLQRNFHGLKARPFHQSDIALLLFYTAIGGITFASDFKWAGWMPVAILLFFYILPLVMYWVVSRCEITETAFKGILVFFVLFGCYLTVTAILEVRGMYSLIVPRYIVSIKGTLEFFGRARGPFLNPVGNGMYMTMSIVSCWLLWPYLKKVHRPIVIGVVGFLCLGVLCTLTRSVWLGALGAMFTMLLLVVPSQHRMRVILASGVLAAGALFALGSNLMSLKRDKHLSASEAAESAKLRPILAAFAYEMFWKKPITGVGLGQYLRFNVDELTTRSFDLPMEKAKQYVQHNVFLSLLVETGLVGVSLFCLTLILWGIGGWKIWHATDLPLWQRQVGMVCLAMLTAYLPNGMFHEMSLVPMQNMLLFFVAGLNRNILDSVAKPEPVNLGRRAADQAPATDGMQWA